MSLLSSAPQPMPSVLPSSFAKLLFLLKPPKTKAREDYSSLLCRALHHKTAQPEMLQKSQRGTKNQDCRASVPSCPPECTGSQVKQHLSTWSTGQAAGFSWASQRKQQAHTHTQAGICRREAVEPFVSFVTLEPEDNCAQPAKTHRAAASQVLRAEVGQHAGIVSADRQGTKAFSLQPRARGWKRYGKEQWCSQHTEQSTRRAFCSPPGIPSIHHL